VPNPMFFSVPESYPVDTKPTPHSRKNPPVDAAHFPLEPGVVAGEGPMVYSESLVHFIQGFLPHHHRYQ
jgi:hypothetical protein